MILDLQYGAYSSISVFRIGFGETFHQIAVNDDIMEILFSVTQSKKVYFYVMELLIERKDNPRNAKLYINRFYNDLKDFKRVEFFN